CIVPSFTVVRQGYGKFCFEGPLNVCNLNVDEIGSRKVTVFPDISMRPPVGEGLNRRVEISLNGIWPQDKSGFAITYPQ
ncbi:hypothetical protein DAPPUDRAFT_59478, partial [Daphnia pulex]